MLTPQQQTVVASRGSELAIAAGAGSGKTRVLIERILWLITGRISETELEPDLAIGLDRLLVVTFTRAAATELRERIDRALEDEISRLECSTLNDSIDTRKCTRRLIKHIRQQRTLLPLAQISTIHSFCQRVINQYGAASGISAERLLSEEDAIQLKHQLATRLIDQQLGNAKDEVLRNVALAWGGRDGVGPTSISREMGDSGLRKLTLMLHGYQQGLIDPMAWYEEQQKKSPDLDPDRFEPMHPVITGLLDEFNKWREEVLKESLREADELRREHPDALHLQYSAQRVSFLQQISNGGEWNQPLAGLHGLLSKCDGEAGRQKLKYSQLAVSAYRRDIPKDSPWYQRLGQLSDALKEEAQDWKLLFSEPWEKVARRENAVRAWLDRLWQLALKFDEEYTALKVQRQVLDFNDLERNALQLLTSDSNVLEPSEVAMELRGRFEEVLVDEYQDVNRLQDAILQLVTRELPNQGRQARVVVGDIKQSIYGFRQAEPEIFRQLVSRLDSDDRKGETHRLRMNFRSRQEILTAINALMQGVLTSELGGEDYIHDGSLEYGCAYNFTNDGEQPFPRARLHILREAAAYNEETEDEDAYYENDSTAQAISELAYHHLAALLREVHAEGQSPNGYLADRDIKKLRPIGWNDLAVLVRSKLDLSVLRIILEQAGIPAQVPSSGSFFEQPDVQDALLILRAIVNPYDDLAMAGVLRGPLCRLNIEDLLIVLFGRDTQNSNQPVWERLRLFLDAPDVEHLPYSESRVEGLHERVEGLSRRIELWRVQAVRESTAEMVWRVLSEAELFVSAAAAPYGAQRIANLYELHDRAMEFDELGRNGLPRMLEYFSAVQIAARDSGELPATDATGTGAVRIMTVHQAKGLEFPCVFLPYLHKQFNEQDLRLPMLCNYEIGLAGQHIDLAGPISENEPGKLLELPEKKTTLAFRRARKMIRVKLVAEELRLFYVALTRAQERLELISVLKDKELEKVELIPAPEPEKARRPWDWVWKQLHAEIMQVLRDAKKPINESSNGWQVYLAVAPDSVEEAESIRREWAKTQSSKNDKYAGAKELTAEEIEVLNKSMNFEYPYVGSTELPMKATITGISKWAEPAGFLPESRKSESRTTTTTVELLMPEFISEGKRDSPLQHGTEIHRLLSLIDVTREYKEEDIKNLWGQAGGQGLINSYAGKVKQMLRELKREFGPWDGVKQSRELPVTMAVSPNELPGLLDIHQIDVSKCHPDDWVLVQGVLDLLLIWQDRAVVLDYKTDHKLDSKELKERYSAQLQWYGRAVRELWPHLQKETVTCAIYALNGSGLVIL